MVGYRSPAREPYRQAKRPSGRTRGRVHVSRSRRLQARRNPSSRPQPGDRPPRLGGCLGTGRTAPGHGRRAAGEPGHAVGRVFRPLRGGRTVEVRAARLGLHRKLHFQDGQWSMRAIRCSPSTSGRTRSRSKAAEADVARNKAQVELAEPQVERGAALVKPRPSPEPSTTSARPTSTWRVPS